MGKCHCLIKHPENGEEREEIKKALERARKLRDSTGIMIALAQLTGPCKGQTSKNVE